MTTHRDSQIDANAPVPAATPVQTRLPWTAPRLERLQGGDTQMPAPKTGGTEVMAALSSDARGAS